MLFALLSSLWMRHALDDTPVYDEATALPPFFGWTVSMRFSKKAAAVLVSTFLCMMLTRGKTGMTEFTLALSTALPPFLIDAPWVVIAQDKKEWKCPAKYVEYVGGYVICRSWSIGWLFLYYLFHSMLVHPTFLRDATESSLLIFQPNLVSSAQEEATTVREEKTD